MIGVTLIFGESHMYSAWIRWHMYARSWTLTDVLAPSHQRWSAAMRSIRRCRIDWC